jgi:TatD DNase family protein
MTARRLGFLSLTRPASLGQGGIKRSMEIAEGMIDSHFHSLHMERRGMDVRILLGACFERGFAGGLDAAVDCEGFDRRRELAAAFPGIRLAAGLSPSATAEPGWEKQLAELEKQLDAPEVRALGEIGLDWYRGYGGQQPQLELFERQLELANSRGLPVVIHNRQADGDLEAVLTRIRPARGGILHCFSGDYELARRLMDLGFFISFAGNITYPGAQVLREVAARIPADRLLLETDAPYLTPQPERGRLNQPACIAHTYALVSGLREVVLDDLIRTVRENFEGCLGSTESRRSLRTGFGGPGASEDPGDNPV